MVVFNTEGVLEGVLSIGLGMHVVFVLLLRRHTQVAVVVVAFHSDSDDSDDADEDTFDAAPQKSSNRSFACPPRDVGKKL